MALLVIAAVACRSNDDSTTTPPIASVQLSPTLVATGLPSSGIEPTIRRGDEVVATEVGAPVVLVSPTATVSVIEGSGRIKPPSGLNELSVFDLEYSTCASVKSNRQGGTAPAPTPTREPEIDDRVPSSTQRIAEYVTIVRSITEDLDDWSASFDRSWQYELGSSQQAAVLTVLERRTSDLCEAIGLITPPHEFVGFHDLVVETVRVRHAWSVIAIEELLESGSAQFDALDEGQGSTRSFVEDLVEVLDDEFAEIKSAPVPMELPVFGVQFELPIGWYVRGTERNPIIVMPFEFQSHEQTGFGPNKWDKGVSVRARKFLNAGTITSEEAAAKFSGLVSSLGELSQTYTANFLGVDAHVSIVSENESSWNFEIIVAVVGNNSVIIDFGCPQEMPGSCTAAWGVIETFTVLGS
jgi:hypothetical protein